MAANGDEKAANGVEKECKTCGLTNNPCGKKNSKRRERGQPFTCILCREVILYLVFVLRTTLRTRRNLKDLGHVSLVETFYPVIDFTDQFVGLCRREEYPPFQNTIEKLEKTLEERYDDIAGRFFVTTTDKHFDPSSSPINFLPKPIFFKMVLQMEPDEICKVSHWLIKGVYWCYLCKQTSSLCGGNHTPGCPRIRW